MVLFSLIGQVLKPKSFAGLFVAAPAVALASLLLTTLAASPAKATLNARGMIIGAVSHGRLLRGGGRRRPPPGGSLGERRQLGGLGVGGGSGVRRGRDLG